MTAHTLTRRQARRRYALIAIVVPLVFFAAVLVTQFALLPTLPNPVAIHWRLDGVADGFAAPWALPLGTTGVGFLVTLLVAVLPFLGDAAQGSARGGAMGYRLMAAITWAETAFIGAFMIPSFVIQIGLEDARDARLSGWWGLAALPIAALLALLAWRITVEPPRTGRETDTPTAMPLAPAEQAVWIQRVGMARGGAILLFALGIGTLAAVVAVGIAALNAGDPGAMSALVPTAILLVLVIVLVATMTVFRVRVDDRGLEVRSAVGWPRIRIRRDEIGSAEVVIVNPMGEYGGWGWRYGINSGWGVVMRAGEAIRVVRTNGKVFTVTVDDAATGAALLNGLIARDAHPEVTR